MDDYQLQLLTSSFSLPPPLTHLTHKGLIKRQSITYLSPTDECLNIHKVADRILARESAEITEEMLTDFQGRIEKAYPSGNWSNSYFAPLRTGSKISSLEIEAERAWTGMKAKVEQWNRIKPHQQQNV